MRRWTLLFLWVLGACRPASTPENPVYVGPDPFDLGEVVHVEIEMSPSDWDSLRFERRTREGMIRALPPDCLDGPITDPEQYTWFDGDATVGGEEFLGVGVRKKGLIGSQSSTRPSIKLDLNRSNAQAQWRGETRMTLNNVRQDGSYMRTCLTYQTFQRAGLPAPRCSFARVWVNGAEIGLYVHVEAIKKPLLERYFESTGGNLYEGTLSDFRGEWINSLEKKTNTSDPDRSDLVALATALESPDGSLLAALEPVLDLDDWFLYWALESVLGHWDGYTGNTNNFFVYSDPSDSDRVHFIPWGADAAFVDRSDFQAGHPLPASVQTNSYLSWRLLNTTEGKARYTEVLQGLLAGAWDEAVLKASLDEMVATLDAEKAGFGASLNSEVNKVRGFIDARRGQIETELAAGGPSSNQLPRGIPCEELVGDLTGSFSTTWASLGQDPFIAGTGSVELNVGGWLTTYPLGAVASPPGVWTEGASRLVGVVDLGTDGYLFLQFEVPPPLLVVGPDLPIDWSNLRVYALAGPSPSVLQAEYIGFLESGLLGIDALGTTPGDVVEMHFSGPLRMIGY